MIYQATGFGISNLDEVAVQVEKDGGGATTQQQEFALAVFC
jgi:hypothetical protein